MKTHIYLNEQTRINLAVDADFETIYPGELYLRHETMISPSGRFVYCDEIRENPALSFREIYLPGGLLDD